MNTGPIPAKETNQFLTVRKLTEPKQKNMKKVKNTIQKTDAVTVTGTIIIASAVVYILFNFLFNGNGNYITHILIG